MRKVNINRRNLSRVFWDVVFSNSHPNLSASEDALRSGSASLEFLRKDADYNTGSISSANSDTLFALAHYFKPQCIAEVGTFIGKSTFAMALGMVAAGAHEGSIYTCDFSNAIELNFDTPVTVQQFPRTSSTQMFNVARDRGVKFDMVFIDGRLQEQDYALLPGICTEDAVIVLDDFEGTEKGVANAFNLLATISKDCALIYPPDEYVSRSHGTYGVCNVGILIKKSLLQFTNQ